MCTRRRLPTLDRKQNMSDKENEQTAFRNAETLHRRAWIDRALSGVRGRLQPDDEADPDPVVQLPLTGSATLPPAGPHLYIVRNRAGR